MRTKNQHWGKKNNKKAHNTSGVAGEYKIVIYTVVYVSGVHIVYYYYYCYSSVTSTAGKSIWDYGTAGRSYSPPRILEWRSGIRRQLRYGNDVNAENRNDIMILLNETTSTVTSTVTNPFRSSLRPARFSPTHLRRRYRPFAPSPLRPPLYRQNATSDVTAETT